MEATPMSNRTDKELLEEALNLLRKCQSLHWCSTHPEFLDRLLAAENRCWNETGIAPPGRSVSPFTGNSHTDEERRDNWNNWYLQKYTELNVEIDSLIGMKYLNAMEEDYATN
jgi:hypothetical protein